MSRTLSVRTGLSALTLMALAGHAAAQSYYIDLGTASGNPGVNFSAAAPSGGEWNNIGTSTPTVSTLKNTLGVSGSVQLIRNTGNSFSSTANANVSGDYGAVMEDYEVSSSGPLDYTITNLPAGDYLVLVYGGHSQNSGALYGTTVGGASGQATQQNGDFTMIANQFKVGGTHSIFYRSLASTGSIQITVGGVFGITPQVAAIQIVRYNTRGGRVLFHVNDNAVGHRSGFGWTNAITDLQDALEASRRIGAARSEIWTASGTYRPTTGTNRAVSFEIPSGLWLYGGFAGNEDTLSERTAPEFFITNLSGSIGTSADTDNSYTVVDASNTSSSTVIDGFTISRGYNNQSGDGRGGGMRMSGSQARVSRTKFISNFASVVGGGVYGTGAYPVFSECLFFNNDSAGRGAGATFESASVRPEFWNCQFLGNTAVGDGGAIYTSRAAVVAVNSIFSGNTGSFARGGACYLLGDINSSVQSVSWFVNCSFSGNSAPTSAGAIYAANKSTASLWNSVVWGNNSGAAVLLDKEVGAATGDGSSIFYTSSTVRGRSGTNGLDPMFVDADGPDNTVGTSDDNLRLKPGSPAIDDGDENVLLFDTADLDGDGVDTELTPVDLAGNARRSDVLGMANGVSAGSPPVDRGAYELVMPDCPADLNNDDTVDLVDFFAFFDAYDLSGSAADVDLNGEVDLGDFFTFFQYFDTGC